MRDDERKTLRDLTNGVNALKEENERYHRKFDQRFDRLEGRVTVLETEGISSVALQHLKRIETRFDEHVDGESEWRQATDRRQDDFSAQLTQISNSTAQTANVLNQIQADMAARGRDAGAKAAGIITIGVSSVAGVAYALLQYFFG